MNKQMDTGFKVWLVLIIVVNAGIGIFTFLKAIFVPSAWITILCRILLIAGAVFLLSFRKMGFHLICAAAAINFLVSVFAGGSIFWGLISAAIMPFITYVFMKDRMDLFE